MPKKAMSKAPPKGAERTANDRFVEGWRERLQETMTKERMSMRRLGIVAGLGSTSVRHMLTQAETITLDSLRRLANAMGTSVVWLAFGVDAVESGGEARRNVRVLPIYGPDDALKDAPDVDRGYLAVAASKFPTDARALLVASDAMRVEGLNLPVPASCVVLKGDVVVWSPSAKAQAGELAVLCRAGEPAVVRRLVVSDDGTRQLVANSVAHGRIAVAPRDHPAAVLLVQRNLTN